MAISALLPLFLNLCGQVQGEQGLKPTAKSEQASHPLLARNPAGEMVSVAVGPSGKNIDPSVRLTGLTFEIGGDSPLDDIEELILTGGESAKEFNQSTRLHSGVKPSHLCTFSIDCPLGGGARFWLAGRLKGGANIDHRVSARCTLVSTTQGDVLPTVKAQGPQRLGVALRRAGEGGVHTHRIPALATTPKGNLLCVYDLRHRSGRDLQGDIDIGLSRSTDGGRTWENPRVIMDMGQHGSLPEEQNGCSDPGIIVDPKTGEIFVFAVWMNGKPGKHQWNGDGSEAGYEVGKAAQMLVIRSSDEGTTWSKPENLTRQLKQEAWVLLAPSPQQGISLRNGTLVMPIQGRDEKGVPFATIMTSQDHGRTWKVGTPAYSGGNECQAALLSDGRIMLNMRNDLSRFRAVSVTGDLGKTWTQHPTHSSALIEPNCNASLIAVPRPSGKRALLFSNPHTQATRTRQTIQVSLDDGMTWPEAGHVLLDAGKGSGYSSMSLIDPDHVGIVYEGSQAQLVFQRIDLREIIEK